MCEEGIYRKNGVSHKINQFIERNFQSLVVVQSPPSNSFVHMTNGSSSNDSFTTNARSVLHPTANSSNSHSNNNNNHSHSLMPHSSSYSLICYNNNMNNANHNDGSSSTALLSVGAMANAPTSTTTSHSSHGPAAAAPTYSHNSTTHRHNSSMSLSTGVTSPLFNLSSATDTIDDTCTITSALKHYLIHLREPLMTFAFNQQFLSSCREWLFWYRATTKRHRLFSFARFLFSRKRHVDRKDCRNSQAHSLASADQPRGTRTPHETFIQVGNIEYFDLTDISRQPRITTIDDQYEFSEFHNTRSKTRWPHLIWPRASGQLSSALNKRLYLTSTTSSSIPRSSSCWLSTTNMYKLVRNNFLHLT